MDITLSVGARDGLLSWRRFESTMGSRREARSWRFGPGGYEIPEIDTGGSTEASSTAVGGIWDLREMTECRRVLVMRAGRGGFGGFLRRGNFFRPLIGVRLAMGCWQGGRRSLVVGSLTALSVPGMVALSSGFWGRDAWVEVVGLQAMDVSDLDGGMPRIPMVVGLAALQSERLVGFA